MYPVESGNIQNNLQEKEVGLLLRGIGTAAKFFWDTMFEKRSFVTGGNGDGSSLC
jgi:hypothetical protein